MWLRLAALAVFAMLSCAQARATLPVVPDPSSDPLTLDEAFARVARAHPDLRLFDAQRRMRDAERDEASLRPARTLGIEVEGLVLNDASNRIDTLETALSLASVFERGGKPDARRALAQSRIDALAVEREKARIDLLADTARRHLDVIDALRQQAIARQDIAQRQRVVEAARRRFQAGASPEAVILSAQAALAQAELQAARAMQQFERARRSLAVLWGDAAPTFAVAEVDPLALPSIDGFDVLAARLQRSPELLQFNDQQRIAEARLRLARTQAVPDVEWQAGLRHSREGNDVSLVGGFSIPLGQRVRAEPGIRAAEAELDVLSLQREAGGLSLLSTLADAHGRYVVARDEVQRLRDDVLPRLVRAEAETERAWRAGAVSHLEWAQLQDERIAALRQQLGAAIEAQAALIELQRLTGQPLLAGTLEGALE
ncbi:MAG: TolC family protein [Luteimonas sp.]|nr:TolC family protein [Luteimonas sp.]